ncbi:hypothetical protein PCE1_003115 [Barthelona sp. PCE]
MTQQNFEELQRLYKLFVEYISKIKSVSEATQFNGRAHTEALCFVVYVDIVLPHTNHVEKGGVAYDIPLINDFFASFGIFFVSPVLLTALKRHKTFESLISDFPILRSVFSEKATKLKIPSTQETRKILDKRKTYNNNYFTPLFNFLEIYCQFVITEGQPEFFIYDFMPDSLWKRYAIKWGVVHPEDRQKVVHPANLDIGIMFSDMALLCPPQTTPNPSALPVSDMSSFDIESFDPKKLSIFEVFVKETNISCVKLSKSVRSVFCALSNGVVWMLDLSETDQVFSRIIGHSDTILSCSWSDYHNYFLTTGMDSRILLWRNEGGQYVPKVEYKGSLQPNMCISCYERGLYFATGGIDHVIRVYQFNTPNPLFTILAHISIITKIVWHPNGCYLASLGACGTVKVWCLLAEDPCAGQCVFAYAFDPKTSDVQFSSSGRYMMVVSSTGMLSIVDLHKRTVISLTVEHEESWNCMTLCALPDEHFVTSSRDFIRVWSLHGISEDMSEYTPVLSIPVRRNPVHMVYTGSQLAVATTPKLSIDIK